MAFTSYPSSTEIIQVAGLLFLNPTSIANEAGWGTKIGYTRDGVAYSPGLKTIELTQEETGITPTLSIFVGSASRFFTNLISWNATALGILFPSLVGGTSGKKVGLPGTVKTGKDFFTTNKLLYVPDDTTNHPAVYLTSIATHIMENAKIELDHHGKAYFPLGCLAKTSQFGPLSEIVL